jgi:hypothetical protein
MSRIQIVRKYVVCIIQGSIITYHWLMLLTKEKDPYLPLYFVTTFAAASAFLSMAYSTLS